MARIIDIAVDGALARLSAVAQALVLTEVVHKATGRTLLNQCRAVRLYLVAREVQMAALTLQEIESLVKADETVYQLVKKHTDAVVKALKGPGR